MKLTPDMKTITLPQGRTVDGLPVHDLYENANGGGWTGRIFLGDGQYREAAWNEAGDLQGESEIDPGGNLVMAAPAAPRPALVIEFSDVARYADSFVQHWSTDEGQGADDQAAADEASELVTRTAPKIVDMAALIAGGPDHRPLLDILGDAESALSQAFEQMAQLRQYTQPTFDNDTDLDNALRDAEDAEGALRALQQRIEAMGEFVPITVPTLLVNITGGVVQGASADGPVELFTLDYEIPEDASPEDVHLMLEVPGERHVHEVVVAAHEVMLEPAFVTAVLIAPTRADETGAAATASAIAEGESL